MQFLKKHWIFFTLLCIGLILRVIFIQEQGLSNDELSAWYRTRFSNWNLFWNNGVKSGDMHPVFYQALLWFWVRIFGDSEWALRSTSLIFYILNSFLIYKIAVRHFTTISGLLIQALYVGLTFTIINTVFARPYNSGVFFLLLAFWSILELKNFSTHKWKWTLILALSLLGAMLSHYFAFFVALILGLSSLFYLGKQNLKYIFIAGFIAIVCFLPHLEITLFQVGRGGLGWLAPPGTFWIFEFIFLFFNESWVLFGIIMVVILSVLIIGGRKKLNANARFSIILFLIAFSGAYLISYLFTPILRELVMLFILPFILFPIFYSIKFRSNKMEIIFIAFLTLIPITDSVLRYKVYSTNHFGVFKEIGEEINHANRKYGFENITFASNYNNVDYINYYVDENLKEDIIDWESKDTPYALYHRVKKSTTPYFCYSVNNKYDTPMFLEIIRKYYPGVEQIVLTKYSSFYLFNKKVRPKLPAPLAVEKYVVKDIEQREFMNGLEISVGELQKFISQDKYFLLQCRGQIGDSVPFYFVSSVERNGQTLMNGEFPLAYFAYDQSRLNSLGKQQDFFLAFNLPDGLKNTDLLKVYFWNPEKGKVQTSNIRLYVLDKNN